MFRGLNPSIKNADPSFSYPGDKRDKQAEISLFVSFYPTNNQRNAVLERIFKEIRSIFIPKENPKQSAEDIKHQYRGFEFAIIPLIFVFYIENARRNQYN